MSDNKAIVEKSVWSSSNEDTAPKMINQSYKLFPPELLIQILLSKTNKDPNQFLKTVEACAVAKTSRDLGPYVKSLNEVDRKNYIYNAMSLGFVFTKKELEELFN